MFSFNGEEPWPNERVWTSLNIWLPCDLMLVSYLSLKVSEIAKRFQGLPNAEWKQTQDRARSHLQRIRILSLLWCGGPVWAVHGEQPRRGLFWNCHSFEDPHHHGAAQPWKKTKIFLGHTMTEKRLIALTMLLIEKRLVMEMTDLNQKVIGIIAAPKEKRANFLFKK